jgi:hypothetical protein
MILRWSAASLDLWGGGGQLWDRDAVVAGKTACLRCIYPDPPAGAQPTCETAGVLGSGDRADREPAGERGDQNPVWRGARAQDNDRGCLERRDPASGAAGPVADCPACGRREFPYLNGERRAPVSLCGHNAVQIHERARPLELRDLAARLAPLGPVRANEFALRFEAPPYLLTIFPTAAPSSKAPPTSAWRGACTRYIGAVRYPCGELCRL